MIRKLKVGEIIREGDFFTQNGSKDGLKLKYLIPYDPKNHNAVTQDDLDRGPIFREIPDSHEAKDKQGYTLRWSAAMFMETWDKKSISDYAQWLLEVAELIEEGE